MNLRAWISAARLRTLPLATAGIFMGYSLAERTNSVDSITFWLCLATAVGLQILANFANDYGDFVKGTDNEDRLGPKRQLQLGEINPKQMKLAMGFLAAICLILGIWLVVRSVDFNWKFILFIILGLASIWAAISYTVGKNAYGYSAKGDVFVFLFFGLVAVLGSAYLFSADFITWWILPALYIGFNSVGVLNLNNMRDLENDQKVGKITTAGLLGLQGAKIYQSILLLIGFTSLVIYDWKIDFNSSLLVVDAIGGLLTTIILYQTWNRSGAQLNPLLRNLSLLTFFAVIFRFQEVLLLLSNK